MSQRKLTNEWKTFFVFLCLLILFSVCIGIALVHLVDASSDAYYSVDLSGSAPQGGVLLIVDGMGSAYIFPEQKPQTLTGETGNNARLTTLPRIWADGFRCTMKAPHPVTELGHSTVVAGNTAADSEMVGYSGSTLMDVFRNEDFLCIGVMQRGDFMSMRQKFDIIVYDETNSVNNMNFAIQRNDRFDSSTAEGAQRQKMIGEIEAEFEKLQKNASSYVSSKDTGDRYAGYNRWALDAACAAVTVMEKYPNQKFVVVISAGASDSTGHYRGYYAYLDSIERLDKDLETLFNKCKRNNLVLFVTADHGMSFETLDKKGGGHSSGKYGKSVEATTVPLVIWGPNVKKGIVGSDVGQEDIAPTFLSMFGIAEHPRHSKGNVLPAKEKLTLSLEFPGTESVQILRSGNEIFSSSGYSKYAVSGLEPGSYTIKWTGQSGKYTQTEATVFVENDLSKNMSEFIRKSMIKTNSDSDLTENSGSAFSGGGVFSNKYVAAVLIVLINLIGGGIAYRIYKRE
ncbi:2,3-bisphosphoglycerate-independent phosphoglycerate mutase [Methanosarcinaceae archaeon Ag5]|uniref:2,3-bisphosphoglycerate-independent phosphoglycerate mutase n=1 Tax=Methanolapillus africanus TaxID=3028297 RepID=A0AAE4MKC6_9EURY|nr:2,3-bisphosphoglycerate-independent phosphoglycerate mutase [Methanosarcinaceae archaeon Ag5]